MMNKRTFRRIFGYTAAVLKKMPNLTVGQDKRDLGRYSIPEAAAFIAVPERTMRYWFLGEHNIFDPAFRHGSTVFLSFNDLTEAYIIETLRKHWDFEPKKLRRALAHLRKRSRMERPLLRRNLSVIPEFQSLIDTVPGKDRDTYVDIAHDQNLVFEGFARSMAMRITRDSKGRPVRIYPWKEAASNDMPVSVDPNVMSGDLVVTGTRIPAKTIYAKKLAGKSVEEIASSYRLNSDLVTKVLQHFEREKP